MALPEKIISLDQRVASARSAQEGLRALSEEVILPEVRYPEEVILPKIPPEMRQRSIELSERIRCAVEFIEVFAKY